MDDILFGILLEAAKTAFTELFSGHDEHFYYCTLVTTGEGHCPYISAWSREALESFMEDNDYSEEDRFYFEWSYADSPYCLFGWEHFREAELYVNERRAAADNGDNWYHSLLDTMERVMSELDRQGVFGSGSRRDYMLINAEVMPPDYTNTARALRLNKEENIRGWLETVAEQED